MSENILKVSILGPTDIGKTCLFHYIAYGEYLASQINPTTVANFLTKNVEINCDIVTLQLWDTAGQENFQCLVPMFARCAQVAVIVYDVTSLSSFNNIQTWYNQMKENSQVPNIIICGNKSDLESEIPTDQFNEMKQTIKCPIYRTSAVTGSGIDILFTAIAEIVEQSNIADNQVVIPHVDFVNPVDQTNHQKRCC